MADKIKNGDYTKKYFTQFPNIIDDSDLDPFEFRVLLHYYRVGECTQGVRTTGKICGMSIGKVADVRRSLQQKGFITILPMGDSVTIEVVDKYLENGVKYRSGGEQVKKSGVHEVNTTVHAVNDNRSPGEHKKNQLRITLEEEETESRDSASEASSENKAFEKEAKERERKRIFVACRDFWLTEVHKGWRFDGVEGKALKGILESGRKHFNKNHEREPSEEEMVNSFKHLCQKLSPYYSSKKLRHINQDFDIILDEMKTGNSKKLRGNSQVSIFSKYRQL